MSRNDDRGGLFSLALLALGAVFAARRSSKQAPPAATAPPASQKGNGSMSLNVNPQKWAAYLIGLMDTGAREQLVQHVLPPAPDGGIVLGIGASAEADGSIMVQRSFKNATLQLKTTPASTLEAILQARAIAFSVDDFEALEKRRAGG